MLAVLLWLHRGGWWGGGSYVDEDVAASFFLLKSRLYQLGHGLLAWSWWDPVPLLGAPRLANVQVGWLSPLSLWFAVMPPAPAWRFYPLLLDGGILAAGYWAVRGWGGSARTATWVALAWVMTENLLNESQHPPYKESLLASLLFMACLSRYWQRPRRRWLGALALCGFLHVASGSPSALFYDHLSMALLLPWLISQLRPPLGRVLGALLAYAGGACLAGPVLLPLQDYLAHGHRNLQSVSTGEFSETYRLTLSELLRRLASEGHWGASIPLQHGLGYPLKVDFSLAVLLLGLSALALPRLRWLALMSLMIMLQTLGERGGLMWVLHRLLPFSLGVRGPERFFFLGSWGFVLVAGLAWQHWQTRSRSVRLLTQVLAGWALIFGVLAQSQFLGSRYKDRAVFSSPPLPPPGSGRLGFLRNPKPQPPLIWESAGALQGMPTLLMPEVIFERGYMQGLVFSQWGPAGLEKLEQLVLQAGAVPIVNPEAPLLLSWGLTWVLQGSPQGFGWRRLQPDPPRHWWSQPTNLTAAEFASRRQGDAFATAHLEGDPPQLPTLTGPVVVDHEGPDYQRLRVKGQGLLVSADQWDPGWRCFHDGRLVPTLRANLALKACWVEPGVSLVEWRYQPLWLRKSWIFLGVGGTLLALAWIVPSAIKDDVHQGGPE